MLFKNLQSSTLPDLAHNDYFLHLKQWFKSQKFDNDNELKNCITAWFKSLTEFLEDRMKKLVKCCEKCVVIEGRSIIK